MAAVVVSVDERKSENLIFFLEFFSNKSDRITKKRFKQLIKIQKSVSKGEIRKNPGFVIIKL